MRPRRANRSASPPMSSRTVVGVSPGPTPPHARPELGRVSRLLEPSQRRWEEHPGRRGPHTLRCDESSHTTALRGFRWQPGYLVETPDFAPSPRDELAFFSAGLFDPVNSLSGSSHK